jgi:hypothetical protein
MVSFKYDTFGRRIYKSSSSGTSIYAYDGDNLVEKTYSSGTAAACYAHGLIIDGPTAILGMTLELRRFARGMPEVEDFHQTSVFTQLVIDENGAMREFSDSRLFADRTAHGGKPSQEFYVIQQRVSKTRSSLSVIFGDVADDFS